MDKSWESRGLDEQFADLVRRNLIHPGQVHYWACSYLSDATPVALMRWTEAPDPDTLDQYDVLPNYSAKSEGWTPNFDLGSKIRFMGGDDWAEIPCDRAARPARSWGA